MEIATPWAPVGAKKGPVPFAPQHNYGFRTSPEYLLTIFVPLDTVNFLPRQLVITDQINILTNLKIQLVRFLCVSLVSTLHYTWGLNGTIRSLMWISSISLFEVFARNKTMIIRRFFIVSLWSPNLCQKARFCAVWISRGFFLSFNRGCSALSRLEYFVVDKNWQAQVPSQTHVRSP